MDELIKRANQGPDSDDEPEDEPEPQDNTSESEEEISILQSTEEKSEAADEDLLDTDGEPNTDPSPSEDPEEDKMDDESDDTPIETPDAIGDTGTETRGEDENSSPTDTSSEENIGTDRETPQDPDHGEKPSLEDEKIDKLKDKASKDGKDDDNPYEASRERFKSLKQKEKEQFLNREKAKSDSGSSDSLKDKYDSYGDGNVLH